MAATGIGAVTATVLNGVVSATARSGSAEASTRTATSTLPLNTPWDGIGGVLWAPWTWALVALGSRGLCRTMPRPVTLSSPTGHSLHADRSVMGGRSTKSDRSTIKE